MSQMNDDEVAECTARNGGISQILLANRRLVSSSGESAAILVLVSFLEGATTSLTFSEDHEYAHAVIPAIIPRLDRKDSTKNHGIPF